MIDLENRFRHPNQSNPKSMDAVSVRTIGVRENAVLLSTMRARCTPKYTLLSLPQLSWKKIVKTVHFLSLRTMLVTQDDCQLRMENCFFASLKRNHTHSHQDPSEPFFWSKTLKKTRRSSTRRTIPPMRTQTLRENDGPIGIPSEDALRQETLPVELSFWKTPPLQCKVPSGKLT